MGVYKTLHIEESERSSAGLLIIQSVFFGLYFGTMDIVSHTLFLDSFKQEDLSKAYVFSGIAGVILTSLYSFVQNKLRFSLFAVINLLVITLFTIMLRMGFDFMPEKTIVFLVFVLFYPLFILSMLGFWGSVTRIYNLRQGKRLFGVIDSGLILGIIISSFSIPLILTTGIGVVNLLFFSIAGTGVALILQLIISQKYLKKDAARETTKEESTENVNFYRLLFKNKYIRLMTFFIFLSVITGFFIQYSFLGATKEKYPDEINFAQFFGAFMGIIMTVSLLVKTAVYSKLLKAYGLKVSLVLSPVILLIFSVLASLTGTFFGNSALSGGFIFFFLAVALSKLMNKTLKDSIEIPAFKLLYQSLNAKIRYNVQARIDGTINEISALSGGLGLAVLGLSGVFHLVHYSYVLIVIILLWTLIAYKLYKEYKASLNRSLEVVYEKSSDHENDEDLVQWFGHQYPQLDTFQQIRGLQLISAIRPDSGKDLKSLFLSLKQENKGQINSMESLLPAFDTPSLKKMNDEELKILLRDYNQHTKKQAILAGGQRKNKEIIQLLVDNLFADEFYIHAYHALKETGSPCIRPLELAFHKTGITRNTQYLIVKLMGEIEGPESSDVLQQLLFHLDRHIVNMAVFALEKRSYRIPGSKKYNVIQSIHSHIEIISWNMNALLSLSESADEKYIELKEAIAKEQKTNMEILFGYLSITYDKKSVNHVRENLERGSAESGNFALELLDLFIDEELKPIVLPVLEDLPEAEKIRWLQNEFPLKKYSLDEQIIQIVNRDFQKISVWSKACAIECIQSLPDVRTKEALISNTFNPNQVLAELALLKLKTFLDDYEFKNIVKRVDKLRKKSKTKDQATVFEKMNFLKGLKTFHSLSDKLLISLAANAHEVKLQLHQKKETNWSFSDINFAIVETGNLIFRSNQEKIEFKEGDLIDLTYYTNNGYTIEMIEDTDLLVISGRMMEQASFEDRSLAQLLITLPLNSEAREVA